LANGRIDVHWTGPGYQNDYIDIAKEGARSNQYVSFEYTRDGSPLSLQVPTEPGAYVIRYIASGNPRAVLAQIPLQVEAVSATVTAVSTAPAGSQLPVYWTGPGGRNDYITIADPEARANQYVAYEYIRDGSPVSLQMPAEPGTYELRYVVQGTDRQILARQLVTVEPVTASIDAAGQAPAGSELSVVWSGPEYFHDILTIAAPDDKPNKYASYAYVREGSPLRIQVPADPGEYELRYVLQGTEKMILAVQPFTVTPVTATLEASSTAAPGSVLLVAWTGPGYRNDYVSIARAGERGYESYEYVRSGSPLALSVPNRPGSYEIRYVMSEGQKILASVSLEVK
jgi:Ca-activated chloride channel family protein